MKEIQYFAYGSNMNLEQMAYRCPDAGVIGPVCLEGYRLAFAGGKNNGVATILPEAGSHVDGVLWEISVQDEKNLDYYEGFPRLYGKETLTVRDITGKEYEVMAYTMNALYRDRTAVPDNDYLFGILEGCESNGIDTGPVLQAVQRAQQELSLQCMGKRSRNIYR